MKDTKNLDLKILEKDVNSEKTREVITEYSNNFEKIDKMYATGVGITSLETNKNYSVGDKLWNSAPVVGSYIGWVNIKEGIYANPRQQNKSYNVGDLVGRQDMGLYYECVTSGKTPNDVSVFHTGSEAFYDVKGKPPWRAETPYVANQIVMKTDGTQSFYYIAEVTGVSGSTEPDWNTMVEGTTIVDGSVTWRKEKNPRWKKKGESCVFKPFGLINN